jgi:hypothetical protein
MQKSMLIVGSIVVVAVAVAWYLFRPELIFAALGLSIGAVKARLHQARLFLRGKLAVVLGYSPT